MSEPFIQIRPKSRFHNMQDFAKIVTYYGQRKTMEKMAQSLRHEINRYIPVGKSHNLQNSYTITTGRHASKGPWFKLEYHNTEKAPYVMYQYYGEVFGPNYATWAAHITLHKSGYDTKINRWEHTGWVSKKGEKKHNMHRPIGIKRHIVMKNGKILDITGYTAKKPRRHARWIEWYCSQPKFEIWKDNEGQKIINAMLVQYRRKYGNGGQK